MRLIQTLLTARPPPAGADADRTQLSAPRGLSLSLSLSLYLYLYLCQLHSKQGPGARAQGPVTWGPLSRQGQGSVADWRHAFAHNLCSREQRLHLVCMCDVKHIKARAECVSAGDRSRTHHAPACTAQHLFLALYDLCMKCICSLYGQLRDLKGVHLLWRLRSRANSAAHRRQDQQEAKQNRSYDDRCNQEGVHGRACETRGGSSICCASVRELPAAPPVKPSKPALSRKGNQTMHLQLARRAS